MDIAENINPLRTISLCYGYGGVELGIESTGQPIRNILISEIEAYPIAVALKKMQKGEMVSCPVWTNLKTLDARPYKGCVDLLTAGFPCQPFSAAGSRKADKDPRHLFPDILRIIDECRPRRVFFENVEGIISAKMHDNTPVLLYVLRTLESRGYRATWSIFSAEECGAPHRRKRVFIMADCKDFRCGGGQDRNSDNGSGIQVDQEDQQSILWGEAQGCGGNLGREEMVDTIDSGHQQNARRDGEAQAIQGEHRSEVCRGMPDGAGEESRPKSEMGYATNLLGNDRKHNREYCQSETPESGSSGSQTTILADTDSERSQGRERIRKAGKEGQSIGHPAECNTQSMADTRCSASTEGQQQAELRPTGVSESSTSTWQGSGSRADEKRPRWPAGAGQYQHEWEEPRVIWKTEQCVGGATDGFTHRVDRLRLLGNGVVPATAAVAWKTLSNRLTN